VADSGRYFKDRCGVEHKLCRQRGNWKKRGQVKWRWILRRELLSWTDQFHGVRKFIEVLRCFCQCMGPACLPRQIEWSPRPYLSGLDQRSSLEPPRGPPGAILH
jgi:hypothetical protein